MSHLKRFTCFSRCDLTRRQLTAPHHTLSFRSHSLEVRISLKGRRSACFRAGVTQRANVVTFAPMPERFDLLGDVGLHRGVAVAAVVVRRYCRWRSLRVS